MIVGVLEPLELGAIVVAIVVVAGLIYWRMRESRIDKDEEKSDDLKPEHTLVAHRENIREAFLAALCVRGPRPMLTAPFLRPAISQPLIRISERLCGSTTRTHQWLAACWRQRAILYFPER